MKCALITRLNPDFCAKTPLRFFFITGGNLDVGHTIVVIDSFDAIGNEVHARAVVGLVTSRGIEESCLCFVIPFGMAPVMRC